MLKVNLMGNTLVIQSMRKGKVAISTESYVSPKSIQYRIDELHQRGQISQQKYTHLSGMVSAKTDLNLSRKS